MAKLYDADWQSLRLYCCHWSICIGGVVIDFGLDNGHVSDAELEGKDVGLDGVVFGSDIVGVVHIGALVWQVVDGVVDNNVFVNTGVSVQVECVSVEIDGLVVDDTFHSAFALNGGNGVLVKRLGGVDDGGAGDCQLSCTDACRCIVGLSKKPISRSERSVMMIKILFLYLKGSTN